MGVDKARAVEKQGRVEKNLELAAPTREFARSVFR